MNARDVAKELVSTLEMDSGGLFKCSNECMDLLELACKAAQDQDCKFTALDIEDLVAGGDDRRIQLTIIYPAMCAVDIILAYIFDHPEQEWRGDAGPNPAETWRSEP